MFYFNKTIFTFLIIIINISIIIGLVGKMSLHPSLDEQLVLIKESDRLALKTKQKILLLHWSHPDHLIYCKCQADPYLDLLRDCKRNFK